MSDFFYALAFSLVKQVTQSVTIIAPIISFNPKWWLRIITSKPKVTIGPIALITAARDALIFFSPKDIKYDGTIEQKIAKKIK